MSDIEEAVAAERERCAKIAESVAEECRRCQGSLYSHCGDARCQEVADRIRGVATCCFRCGSYSIPCKCNG